MGQETVKCQRCDGTGRIRWGHSCPKCFGTGKVTEYRMDPGPLRSFLRPVVTCAFLGLCAWYGLNIWSKMQHSEPVAFHDPFKHLDGGRRGIVRPLGDDSDPFDVPSQCDPGAPQAGLCAAAMQEIRSGGYSIVKCSYWPALSPKEKGTVYYQFWYKSTPPNVVAAVRTGASNIEIRALGKSAVDGCPASEAEARAFLTQNDGIVDRL